MWVGVLKCGCVMWGGENHPESIFSLPYALSYIFSIKLPPLSLPLLTKDISTKLPSLCIYMCQSTLYTAYSFNLCVS